MATRDNLDRVIPNRDDIDPEVDIAEPTRLQDKRDAKAQHTADREPTPDEDRAADDAADELGGRVEEIGENVRDMAQRGANAKGEGRIGG